MDDKELDRLADKLAEKVAEKVAKRQTAIQPVLIRRKDISIMLGNAERSTSTNQIISDPSFPPCVKITENGVEKWRYADVKRWIDRHFEKDANMTLKVLRLKQRLA